MGLLECGHAHPPPSAESPNRSMHVRLLVSHVKHLLRAMRSSPGEWVYEHGLWKGIMENQDTGGAIGGVHSRKKQGRGLFPALHERKGRVRFPTLFVDRVALVLARCPVQCPSAARLSRRSSARTCGNVFCSGRRSVRLRGDVFCPAARSSCSGELPVVRAREDDHLRDKVFSFARIVFRPRGLVFCPCAGVFHPRGDVGCLFGKGC